MKILILSILLIISWVGCETDKDNKQRIPLVVHDTFIVKQISAYPDEKIVVNPVMVTKTNSFGYVSEGSMFFDIANSEDGFMIQIKEGQNIKSVTYCPKDKLQEYLKKVKYKLSFRDSIIKR